MEYMVSLQVISHSGLRIQYTSNDEHLKIHPVLLLY